MNPLHRPSARPGLVAALIGSALLLAASACSPYTSSGPSGSAHQAPGQGGGVVDPQAPSVQAPVEVVLGGGAGEGAGSGGSGYPDLPDPTGDGGLTGTPGSGTGGIGQGTGSGGSSDADPAGGGGLTVTPGPLASGGGSNGGGAEQSSGSNPYPVDAPPARPSVGGGAPAAPVASKLVELVVLHTNDTHGQVLPRDAFWTNREGDDSGGIVRLGAEIARQRALAAEAGAEVLLLDGGDWFQGTPEGVIGTGVPYVSMLASFGYDAMAPGNHDFDFGIEPFLTLVREARPPVVAANVFLSSAPDARRPDWAVPYRIVERAGLEIALVGFITTSTPVISNPETRELDFRDPVEVFGQVAAELPDTVDWILPVGHLGVDADREIALAYPELPLIVGGHSHSMLRNGLRQGETLIVQSGSKASNLGRVDLTLKRSTGEVVEARARLIELYDTPEERFVDAAVAETSAELAEAVAESMDEVVGQVTSVGPQMGPFRSMPLGTWVAGGMRRRMDADVGLHNRGGVRKALEVGPVTRRDLFEVLPFDNTVVAFEVTGAQLDAVLEGCLDGRQQSRIDVAGIRLRLSMNSDGRARYLGAQVGGMPLDPERVYRIATNSYLARGGDAVFEPLGEVEFDDSGQLIRDVLEAEFAAAGQVALPAEDSYSRVQGIGPK